MTKLKKITALALAAVMLMSMAACAKKEEAVVAETEAATEATTEAAPQTEAATEAPETEAQTEAPAALTSSVEATLLHPQIIKHYQSAQRDDNTFAYEMTWSEIELSEEEAAAYPALAKVFADYSANQVDNSIYARMGLLENIKDMESGEREDIPELSSETTLNVVRADTNYVCIGNDFYGYWGGAHGGSVYYAETYRTSDGTKVALTDIITDEGKFVDTVKTKLLDEYEKETFFDIDADMAKYTLKPDLEDESDQERSFYWSLGYDSVKIYFNQYEIAPYAAGIQVVEIKFEDYPELFTGNVDVVPEDRIEYSGFEYNDNGYRYDTYKVSFAGNEYTYEFWDLDDDETKIVVKSGEETIGDIQGDVYEENDAEEISEAPEGLNCSQRKMITHQPVDPAGFKLQNFDRATAKYIIKDYKVSENGMPVEK